jgi:hypothetical protein
MDFDTLNWREEAGAILVSPAVRAAGRTYRLNYTKAPTVTGNYTIEVPSGLELIIVYRVAADLVRPRLEEDGAAHAAAAERIWQDQLPVLRKRYGAHPRPGLKRIRGGSQSGW